MTSTISFLLLFSIKRGAQTLKGGLQYVWNWLVFFLKQLIFLFFRECYKRIPTQTVVTETQPNKTKRKRQGGISKTRSNESHNVSCFTPQKNKLIFWLLLGPLRFSLSLSFLHCAFFMTIKHIFFTTVMPPDILFIVNTIIPNDISKYLKKQTFLYESGIITIIIMH